MTAYRWNPRRELADAQKQLAAFFSPAAHQELRPQNEHSSWTPAVDVYETPVGYQFAVELPGMAPETVEVEVKENRLTIKGERKDAGLKDGERYLHRERPTGRFARVFRMTKPVEAEHVTAEYRNGILFVAVPLRENARPRKIQVQV